MAAKKRLVDLPASPPVPEGWGGRWLAAASGAGKARLEKGRALVAEDRGGGSVILPGPNGSDLAEQDFRSLDLVGRVRRDVGRSFASFLVTAKEMPGSASNRVLGPDFRLNLSETDSVTGQLLWSWSETPDRPDRAAEWDGRALSGHGADVWWAHTTETWDWGLEYKDFSDGFRADLGFVPQVGYREGYGELGRTFRPTGFVSRVRTYAFADSLADRGGALLSQVVATAVRLETKYNGSVLLELRSDRIRAGTELLARKRLVYGVSAVPSRFFSGIAIDGAIGEEIDFEGARTGQGGRLAASAVFRPGDHLRLDLSGEVRWMDVDLPDGRSPRLFTAHVERLNTTWTLTARAWVRVIGQYVGARQAPELYPTGVEAESGSFSASALLGYRLNWQSVVFLGYGDARTLSEDGGLPPESRQLFLKVSYAFQR